MNSAADTTNSNYKIFRRTGIYACSSVLLLFLLGGLVRVTGSGMGCPDWPKCFGLLAPPSCSCELPDNYQEIFLKKRIAKVEKFAGILEKFGMQSKATAIRANKAILVPEAFNATKAWIEYINRLFGVIAGLLALAFFAISLFSKQSAATKIFAFFGLFMLVINAWLGSIVVATNLLPGLVSLHFLLSFLCIFFFMMAMHSSKPFSYSFQGKKLHFVWWFLFVIIMIEVLLGAWARENVELLTHQNTLLGADGMMNYKGMKPVFTIHRFLPAFILVFSIVLALKQRNMAIGQYRALAVIAIISLVQIAFGAINIVYVLPEVSQILHIVLGSLLPVICFYFVLAKGSEIKS